MQAIVTANKKKQSESIQSKSQPLLLADESNEEINEQSAEIGDLNIQEEATQPNRPKRFKMRRLIDDVIINICTCCKWKKLQKFRQEHKLTSYFLLYTTFTFMLAAIGGIIFHHCEYDHESDQIETKIYLYKKINAALPDSMQNDLDKLLSMCTVPMEHESNRWRLATSTFFAFTTASTIGYGFTTPQTFWGRFSTFLYGFPAICLFGLSMVQIGSAVAYRVDKRIKYHQSVTFVHITKKPWHKRWCSWISIELRRTLFVFGLLLLLIAVSGGIFALIQDDWTFIDGMYFMWISISTIGYGDLQPDVIERTVWANFIIWMGLAMTALVIGATQDYFQKKVKKWRQEDVENEKNEYQIMDDSNGSNEQRNEDVNQKEHDCLDTT